MDEKGSFSCKAYVIQTELYSLSSKVLRKVLFNFSSKCRLSFKLFFVSRVLYCLCLNFINIFLKTLGSVSALTDGGLLALNFTHFAVNFSSSLARFWSDI